MSDIIEVEVDEGDGIDEPVQLRFKRVAASRPVRRARYDGGGGVAWWRIEAPGAEAQAALVEDSSDGQAWLIHGGSRGLALVHEPTGRQRREPYLLLARDAEMALPSPLMQTSGWMGWALVGLLTAAACGKKEEGGGSPTGAPTGAASPAAATTTAPARATTAAASASAAPRAPGSAASVKLPPGRTPVPTVEEWDKQKREVTVKGSSALKCETKMVREYLRVSCHGKNDTGGTPTGARLVRGGREAQIFAMSGVVSLIVPVVEGMNFEAIFSWTDKSHPLTIKWPKGSAMPTIVGTFEGAKSPLDRTPDAMAAKLCECYKKISKSASCDELLGTVNEDCDRTWGSDCSMLIACSHGEPGAAPTCRPGWVNAPPFLHCYQLCGPGKPACPGGSSCQKDLSDTNMVCLLD